MSDNRWLKNSFVYLTVLVAALALLFNYFSPQAADQAASPPAVAGPDIWSSFFTSPPPIPLNPVLDYLAFGVFVAVNLLLVAWFFFDQDAHSARPAIWLLSLCAGWHLAYAFSSSALYVHVAAAAVLGCCWYGLFALFGGSDALAMNQGTTRQAIVVALTALSIFVATALALGWLYPPFDAHRLAAEQHWTWSSAVSWFQGTYAVVGAILVLRLWWYYSHHSSAWIADHLVVSIVVLSLVLLAGFYLWTNRYPQIGLEQLPSLIRGGKLQRLVTDGDQITLYTTQGIYTTYKDSGTNILTLLRLLNLSDAELTGITIEVAAPSYLDRLLVVIPYILLVILACLLYYVVEKFRNPQASIFGGVWRQDEDKPDKPMVPEITFKDVAGYPEAKSALMEVVDSLRSPLAFRQLGTSVPRNILLVGPPGTGKTLLAQAVANGVGANIFYLPGSAFVELYVGVGASRLRDLFKQARKKSPALVFIDEVDAVASRRSAGGAEGSRERDGTLNQLLTEIDGFIRAPEALVIFMAATNREDVLDPAFVQRMERRIVVGLPNQAARQAIIKKHAANKRIGWDEPAVEELAVQTAGFSGRELKNLVQEAPRQTYQRLMDEARKRCVGSQEPVVLPVPNKTLPSPVVFAGKCKPGGTVTITISTADQRLSVMDDDEDGIWVAIMGLPSGSHISTIKVEQNSFPAEQRIEFIVGSTTAPIRLDDLNEAFRRVGGAIPKVGQLDAVVTALKPVVGQIQAKRALATAAALHYDYARRHIDQPGLRLAPASALLVGPPGVGKTYLAQQLAKHLNVPFVSLDSTILLQPSAGGSPVEILLRKLLQAADGNVRKAQSGIVCLQHLDLLASGGQGAPSGWGSYAQEMLLTLIRGDKVDVSIASGLHNLHTVRLTTRDILFVCEGQFRGLIPRRGGRTTVERVEPQHLVNYGLSPDLVACFPMVATVDELSSQQLSEIVVRQWNDYPISEYRQLLQRHGIEIELNKAATALLERDDDFGWLSIDDPGLLEIAEQAIQRESGARGLASVIRDICVWLISEIPDAGLVIIDKDLVQTALKTQPIPGNGAQTPMGAVLQLQDLSQQSPTEVAKFLLDDGHLT